MQVGNLMMFWTALQLAPFPPSSIYERYPENNRPAPDMASADLSKMLFFIFLPRGPSAVNNKIMARDKAGFIQRQKQCGIPYVLGLPDPAHRGAFHEAFSCFRIIQHAFCHVRCNDARIYCIDSYPILCKIQRSFP